VNQLTTVAAVQAYTGTAGNSAVLAPLVASASSAALRFLQKDLFQTTYTNEKYRGSGTQRLILRQIPVTAVTSVQINGVDIAPSSNACQSGFVFDDLGLFAIGFKWPQRPQIVSVSYTAGYPPLPVTDSPVAIPASPFVLASQNPYWQSDVGVTFFSGGTPLVKVNVSPTTGQYFVDAFGNYTFAAADAGLQVVISYMVIGIPPDISQACNEIVGLNFTRRGKLNVKSKTIDAQTEAYITDDWPPSALMTLQQWQRSFAQT
jgi:hypothetical protein